MKLTARVFKFLAVFLAALILALVPTARSIRAWVGRQVSLGDLSQGTQLFEAILLIGALGAAACCIGYYARFLKQRSQPGAAAHLVALAALSFAIERHIGTIYVEYAHVVLYAAFYCCVRLALPDLIRAIPVSLGACFLLGLTDEGLQLLHPERVGDLRDLLLNMMGACMGLLLLEPQLPTANPTDSPPESVKYAGA